MPYVMQCIELLFVSCFTSVDNVLCTKDAIRVFNVIEENKKKILNRIA